MLWFIVLYGIIAMGLSAYLYLRCHSKAEYILGGRKMNSPTVGLTAQTAISGYFFTVCIPLKVLDPSAGIWGAVFAAAGMVCGIFLSRFAVSRRLRIYSEIAGNSLSFPEYVENRFKDKTGILRAVCAAVILIFDIIFAASIITVSADILDEFTSIGRVSAMIVCGLIIAIFVFLGGFPAIAATSHIKSLIMLLFFVFIIISGINADVFNPQGTTEDGFFVHAARTVNETGFTNGIVEHILSFISYAILFFGLPMINTVYMSAKERRTPKRRIAYEFAWAIPSAVGAVLCGIIAKTVASGSVETPQDYVKALSQGTVPIIGSMIISLIFIVCLSTAESAVFSAGTALSYDLFAHSPKKQTTQKESHFLTRLSTVVATVAAVLYAISGPISSFFSFDFIIMLISASFGPTVLFGLFSNRLTARGSCISTGFGIISACVFNYFLPIYGLHVIIGTIPSFLITTAVLFAVSLIDKKSISKKMENEFGRTKEIAVMK